MVVSVHIASLKLCDIRDIVLCDRTQIFAFYCDYPNACLCNAANKQVNKLHLSSDYLNQEQWVTCVFSVSAEKRLSSLMKRLSSLCHETVSQHSRR